MKLIFAGTPDIAADALRELALKHEIVLAITREDAPVGRNRIVTPSPVALVAEQHGIKVLKRNRITPADLPEIRESGADLALVIAYGALIPSSALELMPWWNLHFSLLPKWRGAAPLQYSIMHLGDGAGITLFELEAGLDTGPIIAALPMQIDPAKTYGEHLEIFTSAGLELITDSLAKMTKSRAQTGEPSFAPKLDRGLAKLDFSLPSQLVSAKIMALNPEPVAFGLLDNEPFRILRASSLGTTNWAELDGVAPRPGRVIQNGGRVLVECGGGSRIELQSVQPAGKKAMAAGDWFRGLNKEVVLE
jgi:methionyl-tRNA formyltransferase